MYVLFNFKGTPPYPKNSTGIEANKRILKYKSMIEPYSLLSTTKEFRGL